MAELSSETERHNTLWERVVISARGAAFQLAIESGFSYKVFVKMSELTHIDKTELASCLSIAPATLLRRAKAGQINTEESDKLYRFTDVLVATTDLFESNQDEATA